ncbi:hypothetical protein [Psychroflexus salis]|uniref:Outer membrane protein beta-barrel domain-containing protein n=1 Tax=Psychroflexus salis TaxID=1526574 RepID=A0A916ZTV3_9FLAO|nr:hypothetical protein [Psychroflexus salis]GGE13646.1 hypothetical protein GCM10010831_13750 [Psychroflexus salis]
MKSKLIIISLLFSILTFAQEDKSFISKFEIAANYGPAGNFFVDYGRDMNTNNDLIEPIYSEVFDEFQLYQKNFIGTSGGINITYNFNNKNAIAFSFDRTLNYGKYNGVPVLNNGTPVIINDIKLRHLNHFYSLTYRRSLDKKNTFYASLGIMYIRMNQAEIQVGLSDNLVIIEERNYDNSLLEEGGVVFGLEKYFYKSGKFDVGIQSKVFI